MRARNEELTKLEAMLFDEAFRRYGEFGFPESSSICVVTRNQDEAGRQTNVLHPGSVKIDDGVIVLGQVQLGITDLLVVAELYVADHSIRRLALTVVGERMWTGDEPDPMELFVR